MPAYRLVEGRGGTSDRKEEEEGGLSIFVVLGKLRNLAASAVIDEVSSDAAIKVTNNEVLSPLSCWYASSQWEFRRICPRLPYLVFKISDGLPSATVAGILWGLTAYNPFKQDGCGPGKATICSDLMFVDI